MLFLVIPTLIVIPMSFSDSQYLEFPPEQWSLRWYGEYFDSTKWMRALPFAFGICGLNNLESKRKENHKLFGEDKDG